MCAHEQEAEKESLLHLLVDYQNEVSGRVCSLHHINVIIYACYTFILVWCLRGRVMKKKLGKTTFLTGTLYSPLSLFRPLRFTENVNNETSKRKGESR